MSFSATLNIASFAIYLFLRVGKIWNRILPMKWFGRSWRDSTVFQVCLTCSKNELFTQRNGCQRREMRKGRSLTHATDRVVRKQWGVRCIETGSYKRKEGEKRDSRIRMRAMKVYHLSAELVADANFSLLSALLFLFSYRKHRSMGWWNYRRKAAKRTFWTDFCLHYWWPIQKTERWR